MYANTTCGLTCPAWPGRNLLPPRKVCTGRKRTASHSGHRASPYGRRLFRKCSAKGARQPSQGRQFHPKWREAVQGLILGRKKSNSGVDTVVQKSA